MLIDVKKITIMLSMSLLAGCAGEQAFVKAKTALENGYEKEGLSQLKDLVEKNPTNIQYKNLYYKQRESSISKLLRKAEQAKLNGEWELAENNYNKILEIDSANARAKDGILANKIAMDNDSKIQEISSLVDDNQLDVAKEKLRNILNQEPSNTKAKQLYSSIEKQQKENGGVYAKVISKYTKPISLELKEANIKMVFQLLSKAADINFILDKELKADTKVSIFVKHTTIDEALKNIFATTQLSSKILNENSVLVFPNAKKSEYEEILVKTFYLTNVEVKKAEELIKTVLKVKDVFTDEKLNILVMRDSAENIRTAEKLISSYDIGDPEVLLEVEILEISNSLATELGLRWPNQLSVGVTGTKGNGQLRFDEVNNFKSNMARLSITDPLLIMNLRGTDGTSNLLANPHIRVKNHKKAKVHIGDRVPVITNTSTATGFVSDSVSYLDVGLKLDVEPSITMDDEVSIEVGLEVSNIVSEVQTKSGSLSYRLGTRNAATTLRLKNGETQILAGLINSEERTSADRVPGLARLPIIGRLFSSKNSSNSKSEIVLLITPKIIRNIAAANSNLIEFSMGTETGNAVPRMSKNAGKNEGFMQMESQLSQDSGVLETNSQADINAAPALTPIELNIPPPPPSPLSSNNSESNVP